MTTKVALVFAGLCVAAICEVLEVRPELPDVSRHQLPALNASDPDSASDRPHEAGSNTRSRISVYGGPAATADQAT
jgi:hypothetical protein